MLPRIAAEGRVVHGDPAVLGALLQRRDAGSRPGQRVDDHRIALVVGGGGMRGAYSGGMVHALEELGLHDAFDEVYGTSAGAFTAGAFVTGQARGAALMFHENLACREFIDLRRAAARRGPAVSLDYVIEVLTGVRRMHWEVFTDSLLPLRLVATRVPELRPEELSALNGIEDWQCAMRAAAAVPLLAGPPVEFRGARWIDGSVTEPLAVERALAAGSTHVLALLSRPASEVRDDTTRGGREPRWVGPLDRVVPGLGTLANGSRRYAADLRLVAGAARPTPGGPHLCAIAPLRSSGVRALSIDVETARRSSEIGHASVHAAARMVTG